MSQLLFGSITYPSTGVLLLFGWPVQLVGSNGFAANIVGALLALGVLVLIAVWLSSKPKKPRR